MSSDNQQHITIRMPNEMQKGVYANLVSVTVGHNEVIIDFAFHMPIPGQTQGDAVSRVVMSPEVARKFLSAFQNAVIDFGKHKSTTGTDE